MIQKIIPYFSIRSVYFSKPNDILKQLISGTTPEMVFDDPPYDLIYIETVDEEALRLICDGDSQVHNDTVVLIRAIHKNKVSIKRWNTLLQSGRFRVSIDLFHCGMLFFRTEQAAEHFRIRI